MKVSTIIAITMSVGIWSQYAVAADYSDIGKTLPADILTANHCTAGYYQGGCRDPLYWSLDYGDVVEDCNSWMVEPSCTKCQSGYVLKPYACIPNNEQGTFYDACMPDQMTPSQIADATFVYTCRCSDLFSETGRTGYLFRGCYSGSIEFKCDASNKYYQTSTSKTPTCTVSTDSDGNFTFSRCSGCSKCNDTSEFWRNANTGYQRAYKKKFTSGTPSTCTDVNLDKWRCAIGYYGTSTNGTSGCNACPSFESAGLTEICNSGGSCPYIKSTPGSNTQITDCIATTYEPDLDVYLNDTTGNFHWWPVDDTINIYGECNWQ